MKTKPNCRKKAGAMMRFALLATSLPNAQPLASHPPQRPLPAASARAWPGTHVFFADAAKGDDANAGARLANRADCGRVVDHIEHLAKLAVIAQAGIGTDHESGDVPNGLKHAGQLPNLTAALLRGGFGETDMHKILTGNFQRVCRRVLDQT